MNRKIKLDFVFTLLEFSFKNKTQLTVNDDPIRHYINNANYVGEISKPTEGDMDYALIGKNKQAIIGEMSHRYTVSKASYNSIILKVDKKANQIPFFLYKGIPYEVKVNDKNTKIKVGSILKLKVKRGDIIQISSKATWWNYATFIVSTIAILIISISIVFCKGLE